VDKSYRNQLKEWGAGCPGNPAHGRRLLPEPAHGLDHVSRLQRPRVDGLAVLLTRVVGGLGSVHAVVDERGLKIAQKNASHSNDMNQQYFEVLNYH
jgi:hypothetical protein